MNNSEILRFLKAIDTELAGHAKKGEILDLYLIGRSALILEFGLSLMTKDVDIVYVHGSKLQERAIETFGSGTLGAGAHGFYLETVPPGLPPLPAGYQARCIDIPGAWTVIRPKSPEIHDLAMTKLKRFHARDREDLQILCDTGRVTSEGLQRALDSAFIFAGDEDEDAGRKAAYANLRIVLDYLEGKRRAL
jgi:hypothetical protein